MKGQNSDIKNGRFCDVKVSEIEACESQDSSVTALQLSSDVLHIIIIR
jgi:hypothetical protein